MDTTTSYMTSSIQTSPVNHSGLLEQAVFSELSYLPHFMEKLSTCMLRNWSDREHPITPDFPARTGYGYHGNVFNYHLTSNTNLPITPDLDPMKITSVPSRDKPISQLSLKEYRIRSDNGHYSRGLGSFVFRSSAVSYVKKNTRGIKRNLDEMLAFGINEETCGNNNVDDDEYAPQRKRHRSFREYTEVTSCLKMPESDPEADMFFMDLDEDLYTDCNNVKGNVPQPIPARKIAPIKRKEVVAKPMRILLLRRLTLMRWLNTDVACCRRGCCGMWEWITKTDVFVDFMEKSEYTEKIY